MTVYDPIGHIGAFLIALVPQVYKTYTTKSVGDISLPWTIVLSCGLATWLLYSFINSILPAMIFTSIELTMAVSLLVMKLLYR